MGDGIVLKLADSERRHMDFSKTISKVEVILSGTEREGWELLLQMLVAESVVFKISANNGR